VVVSRHDVVVPSLVVGSVSAQWLTRWIGDNEVDAWCSRWVAVRCAFPMLSKGLEQLVLGQLLSGCGQGLRR